MMGASSGHESLEDDLSAFGLSSNTYDHLQPPEEFQLYEENCLAFEVFCSCSTQWRFAGMSGVQTGLDYSAVESVMRMMNIEKTAETFQKVRLIEIGALNALSEKRG